MDGTLSQVLQALYQAHQTIDAQAARIATLEQVGQQQLTEIQSRIAAFEAESLPPGWRLVKDA